MTENNKVVKSCDKNIAKCQEKIYYPFILEANKQKDKKKDEKKDKKKDN